MSSLISTTLALLLGASPAADAGRGADGGVVDAGRADAAVPDGGLEDGGARHDGGSLGRLLDLRALADGALATSVEPQQLFDADLSDAAAVALERLRLELLLAQPSTRADAGPGPDAGVDARRWADRLELDRARLAFLSLPDERRAALLADHAARRLAATPSESEEARRAREADAERQQALEAARKARSEAERLASEEMARLIGLEGEAEALKARLADEHDALLARKDTVLGWQRRVRDVRAGTADADSTYDALRRALRAVRDELEKALDEQRAGVSALPELGPDLALQLPESPSVEALRERRTRVQALLATVHELEVKQWEARAASALDEMNTLNRERLGLLELLSPSKRAAITGLTEAGFDQARAEGRHLLLTLSAHRLVLTDWLQGFGKEGRTSRISGWAVTMTLVPWLVLAVAFFWWRRRSPAYLTMGLRRLVQNDRDERLASPSRPTRAFRFLMGVHRPLEWLLFFWALLLFIPEVARGLLEVQLFTVAVGWTLGGSLVVAAINTLANVTGTSQLRLTDETDDLRLRSLRLVGRVVVAFALVLVLSARLVGKGTVYSWVLVVSGFAALPVFLLLVRWWRETVFRRVERQRRKTSLQEWVLANRNGWKSFFAASLALVQLFAVGAFKVVQTWVASFEVARRALAYLFKRDIDRLAEESPVVEGAPLGSEAFAALAPDRPAPSWVACPADEHLAALKALATSGDGGVAALVGGRGQGKTTLLAQLAGQLPGAVVVRCTKSMTLDALREAHAQAPGPLKVVLLDDASSFIKPLMGGLKPFDEVLAFARGTTDDTLWVFALDRAVWPFLRRARDARPLFDELFDLEPWADEHIGKLLAGRSEEAGLTLDFGDLMEPLPASADEIDRLEVLSATRTGYFRMVWDHAGGNPASALESWRCSLSQAVDGVVKVRRLKTPSPARLEGLPDAAVFILRGVLQMPGANLEDLSESTRLSSTHVRAALRYGQEHGYLEETGGAYRVTWHWLRAVVLFLERRHLLVNS